jgi:hypothetical protein
MMKKYAWDELNSLQIGKYAEYFVKMEFTQYGFDVYCSEVDDRGIDFVVRRERKNDMTKYYDVQVKSVRENGYVFFPKDKFKLRENLLATVVVFPKGEMPQIYLIPSLAWKTTDALLVSHDYKGKKSEPEWGLNISRKNMPLLERFAFQEKVKNL